MFQYRNFRTLEEQEPIVQRARYGFIDARDGRVERICFRPWPKLASLLEVWWTQRVSRRRSSGDFCRLYFNAPMRCPGYMNIPLIASSRDGTLATVHAALAELDRIAEIRLSAAIVCEVVNSKISDRILRRHGWVRHLEQDRKRHYIKRFTRPLGVQLAESIQIKEANAVSAAEQTAI